MLYGIDAVHGHNNLFGATIFPHNIGLGATRDAALVQQIGRATAEEIRGHRDQLGLCSVRVRRPGRPLGSHLRVVRRGPRNRDPDDVIGHGSAGAAAGGSGVGTGHCEALHRRRWHRGRGQ